VVETVSELVKERSKAGQSFDVLIRE
jgi:hypothetical protein